MRKKFKKRLLGIILTILMVVSVIPVQQVQPVKAASNESNNVGQTFYLDASKSLGGNYWDTNTTITVEIYEYGTNVVYKSQTMTKVSDATNNHLWSITLPCNTWKMYVYRTKWRSDNFTWELHRNDNDETKNLVKVTGWKDSYEWGTYTPQQETKTGTYYAKADLVDYFNDARIDKDQTSGYSSNNQGDVLGDKNEGKGVAFSYFNSIISNKFGKDSRTIPLYVGALLFTNNRVGRSVIKSDTYEPLSRWNSTANVALANKEQGDGNPDKQNLNVNASVQGLVNKELGTGGALLGLDGTELPFFSKKFADSDAAKIDNKPVMQYFSDYQFPFTESTENSVTTYSYDSASDKAVYIDWDDLNNKKLMQSDTAIYNNTDNTRGYYPFNRVSDASAQANINYGFGTKFTIPFTINDNGTINGEANGKPITFDFTGDDDVWVFLDGKLILDMGGSHAKATGSINFKDLTATVTNAATASTSAEQMSDRPSNVIADYQTAELNNFAWTGQKPMERSTVSTAEKILDFNTAYGSDYANTFKDSSKVHTLTMFYMERGMYDSNMKIQFTINPLPSGLSVSKQVDTKNVNEGLKTAAANKDAFEFTMMKKGESEENLTNVSDVNYSFYDGKNTSSKTIGADGKIKLKDKQYANSFENANGTDAFKPGDYFKITETLNKNYTTKWFVTDLDKKTEELDKPVKKGEGTVAEFSFGEHVDEFSKANYNVNFVNTPKVGTVNITKAWKGDIPETLKKEDFPFRVEVDLDGADGNYGYSPYALKYTVDGKVSYTDADGNFKLKCDQIAAFEGIPTGATVKVTETKTTDKKSWEVSGSDEAVSQPVKEKSNETLTITNATMTIPSDKVIYVETGKDTLYQPADVETGYTVSNMSNGLTYTEKGFNGTESNKSYTAKYTGSNSDGAIVNGTITVYTYKATDKVYVFDYGLESDIAKTNDNNDGLFQDGTFYNDIAEKNGYATTAKLNKITHEEDDNQQTTITADQNVIIDKNGSATGAVTFKPIAFMDKVENYNYTADITKNGATLNSNNPETGTTVHGTIKTMPANVVYYEDNFENGVKVIAENGTTIVNDTPIKLSQSNSQKELYGHDDAYANPDNNDSAGSSTKMPVGATATFTFKGTGFDLISRTSGTSGSIVYKVKNMGTNKVERYGAVDTYYNNGDLYQLPVVSIKDLTYGTYEVTLLVPQSNMESASTFYLDGVRIYNPLNDEKEKNASYIKNEVSVKTTSIREMILGTCDITESGITDDSGSYITSAEVPGSTSSILYCADDASAMSFFGDVNQEDMNQGASVTYSSSLAEYLRRGPSNEVYLTGTTGIGFVVKPDETGNSTLQVEAKKVDMSTESEYTAAKDTTLSMVTTTADGYAKQEISAIDTKTAMYYNIPVENAIPLKDGSYLVVLTGTATKTQCISLSNLKQKGYTVSSPANTANQALVEGIIGPTIPADPTTYGVEVSFVTFIGNVQSGRKATAEVTVPKGSEVDGFQVYANGNPITTKMTPKGTENGKTTYYVTFNMTKARGTFTLDFVPYKFDTDGKTRIESETYLRKTVVVRR